MENVIDSIIIVKSITTGSNELIVGQILEVLVTGSDGTTSVDLMQVIETKFDPYMNRFQVAMKNCKLIDKSKSG